MAEQERPQFSDEERQEISSLAKKFTDVDQDTIDHLEQMKVGLCMASLRIIDSILQISDRLAIARELTHDIQVIDEVLRQTRAIRQIQGVDDVSELDRHAQEAGLGSIFDENSIIGANLQRYLR